MTLTLPAWIGASAAAVLAVAAGLAAWQARRVLRDQSRMLALLQRQAQDQAQLLRVQVGELDAHRGQFREQRRVNEAQAEALAGQSRELAAALAQREDASRRQRRDQASQVGAAVAPPGPGPAAARVRNDSGQPVYALRVTFHPVSAAGAAAPFPAGAAQPAPVRLLAPGAERLVEVPGWVARPVTDDTCAIGLVFTDAAGTRWHRDPDGGLAPA